MSTAKKMSTMTSFLGRIRKYFGGSSLYISLSTRIPVMEWENLDHLSLAATRSNRKGPKVPKILHTAVLKAPVTANSSQARLKSLELGTQLKRSKSETLWVLGHYSRWLWRPGPFQSGVIHRVCAKHYKAVVTLDLQA